MRESQEIERLRAQVERYEREIRELRDIIDEKPGKMVGNSGEMRNVYKQIKACSNNDAPALIYGNDGTGKELTARTIAELSPRKDKLFVVMGCANLREGFVNPANTFESELFGYERGAFLGANSRHIGKAELANGGTLFLDDVSALTLPDQEKLLRFLQGQTFSRLGGNMQFHSDVRIIAASRQNLEQMMQQKLFREDLFYRLNIVQINLPDLAQRKSDILLLAEHFIAQVNLKYGKHVVRLTTPAIDMLMSYHWPGNVQELENCIERAALATTDESIHSHDLPPTLQTEVTSKTSIVPEGSSSLSTLLENYEKEILTEVIRRHNGNLSAAGREISVSPRMMHYKAKKFGLS
ncbi:MAG: sigma-54-dependent Fis family transcriptional regulator [Fibrobacter sp.]|jgi:transcriptional regulator with PAS, ATPase and Fis domain|nr:sigma-54-dependent Fis family transcriptional regulator [Fibrobacter sp.]